MFSLTISERMIAIETVLSKFYGVPSAMISFSLCNTEFVDHSIVQSANYLVLRITGRNCQTPSMKMIDNIHELFFTTILFTFRPLLSQVQMGPLRMSRIVAFYTLQKFPLFVKKIEGRRTVHGCNVV